MAFPLAIQSGGDVIGLEKPEGEVFFPIAFYSAASAKG
jgi:hypothetical protein